MNFLPLGSKFCLHTSSFPTTLKQPTCSCQKIAHVCLFTNSGIPRDVRVSPASHNASDRCWIVNGARMHRKGSSRLFGKKTKTTKPKSDDKGPESVHRTNIQLAALPVILVFNIIRVLAFQLWLLLSLVCRVGAHALPNKTKQCESESEKGCQAATPPSPSADMPATTPGKPGPSVGPGEPALAKQKHHHRKAFEYISKALKIDEEDKGKSRIFFRQYEIYLSVGSGSRRKHNIQTHQPMLTWVGESVTVCYATSDSHSPNLPSPKYSNTACESRHI